MATLMFEKAQLKLIIFAKTTPGKKSDKMLKDIIRIERLLAIKKYKLGLESCNHWLLFLRYIYDQKLNINKKMNVNAFSCFF